jgi:hypothetical protein
MNKSLKTSKQHPTKWDLWQPTTIEGKKAKLLQKWFGPYFITEIKNEGRVIYLKDSEGIKLPLPVSVNRIWPYPEGILKDTNPDMQMDVETNNINEFNDDNYASMSSDDEDEDGNEEPDVINEPDDDSTGHYVPSNDEESSSDEHQQNQQHKLHIIN